MSENRKVSWHRAVRNQYDQPVRYSKCGQYRIETRPMCSGRNGYMNARAYRPQKLVNGQWIDIAKYMPDEISMAYEYVEMDFEK